MLIFEFTNKAKKDFLKLELKDRERVVAKLKALKGHINIFAVLKTLHGFQNCTHRLRIGKFRALLKVVNSGKITIVAIGYRGQIYN